MSILGASSTSTANGFSRRSFRTDTLDDKNTSTATTKSDWGVRDVFDKEFGTIGSKLHLQTDTQVRPTQLPVRRVPVAVKMQLQAELERKEGLDVIEKVEKPTPWVSSLVLVKKSNGKLRLCLDPKPLNEALQRSQFRMPTLEDILPELSHAKVFSVADVKNGYWHIALDEDSQDLTTFGTPFGRYKFKRMPFGIKVAPEVFQQKLHEALTGLPGIYAVADDILIAGEGRTYAEAEVDHDKKLKTLLRQCREKKICLNKDKLRLKMRNVTYMGHLLTDEGLQADPKKLQTIQELEKPSDVAGVWRIIGMVKYTLPNLCHSCWSCVNHYDNSRRRTQPGCGLQTMIKRWNKSKQPWPRPPFWDILMTNLVSHCSVMPHRMD